MFDSFRVKKPLYPIVGFTTSIAALIYGMLFSKSPIIFAFIGIMLLIYFAYGLFNTAWKMTAVAFAIGLIVGMLAFATNRNFASLWQTVGRMMLFGACAVPLISVPPANLTRCLNKLKCPRIITLGMLVTIRFIPILIGEIKRIWEAMKVRGVRMAWYRPDCLYRAFFIPLIIRVIGISDILSLSLETRGFELTQKNATVYHDVSFKARDAVFLCLMCIAMVGSGALKWAVR